MFRNNPTTSEEYPLPSTNPYGNYTLVDTVPKDMLHMVNAHWYQFPPMNPLWYSLVGFYMVLMGTLSLVGNFVVIWIFMTTKSLRSPANLLIVNLAFSDFFMMLTMFPPNVVNCYWQTWTFGPFLCEIYGFFGSTFGTASIWTMVWITADRYNVIVKGMSAEPLTTNGALMRIAGTWTCVIAWALPPIFDWNAYVPEGNMTVCGTDYLTEGMFSNSYLYAYTAASYVFPLFYNIFCYTFIIKAVANHEKGMREQAKKMGIKSLRSENNQKTSAECRLAKVALIIVALWFIAWTPFLVTNISGMLNKSVVTPLSTIWGSVFAKANAVYNPLVYAISHPKYRAALEKKLPYLACKTEDQIGGEAASASTEQPAGDKTENA